jgi:uncharacterized protein YdhG (YjbR/CyaY superfamily)
MAGMKVTTVGEYLASQPRATQAALKRVRSIIRKTMPGAEETISYGIPAYKVGGRTVLYLAGWKEHYSLYPSTRQLERAFTDELAPYELSKKGTIRFPLSEPVPAKLIERIAKFRVKESTERAKATGTATSRSARRP